MQYSYFNYHKKNYKKSFNKFGGDTMFVSQSIKTITKSVHIHFWSPWI